MIAKQRISIMINKLRGYTGIYAQSIECPERTRKDFTVKTVVQKDNEAFQEKPQH